MNREDWLRPPDFAPTIPRMVRHSLEHYGARTLIAAPDRHATFADIDRESARLARALVAVGVGKATRVGILMGNGVAWITAYLAITRIGAIAVLISTLYQRKDLAWVLRHADIHTLLMVDRYLGHDYVARVEDAVPEIGTCESAAGPLLLSALPYLRHVVLWGEDRARWATGQQDAIRRGESDKRTGGDFLNSLEDLVSPADIALVMYTSGSTADPKGIMHSHGVIVRRLSILRHIRSLSENNRALVVGPFCWAAGFISLNLALLTGSSVICPATSKVEDVLDAMDRELPTDLSAQPGMIKQLREHSRMTGGTMNPGVVALLDRRLQARRTDAASRGLGMTETFGQHSIEPRNEQVPEAKLEAFGRGVPDMERRIRDPKTGTWLGPNEEGVLWLRGPNMTVGLYKQERQDAFDADGFYNTGDLCRIDEDGYLYFNGRSTEMIKTSGANVAPREVELVLEAYPEIQEASVFGVARDGHDAVVTAVVIPKPGATVDVEALRARMRHDIATFKVPKAIFVMSNADAPRTGSGKLHKPKLREIYGRAAPPA